MISVTGGTTSGDSLAVVLNTGLPDPGSCPQRKETILRVITDTYVGSSKRKTLKGSGLSQMEKQLYKWFLNQRNKYFVVSGEMIKQKAKSIHSEIKETNKEFTASEGWLQRFKKRFGIRFLKISGEKLSSQPELIDPFKKQLKNKMQKLGIT
ncbi:jerky protein homolog [Euwallacea similis]|uniref:jerky protein homolog n=1 Tax=Euwallacea similis TaxID=1736056 RepID=UPI00344C5492